MRSQLVALGAAVAALAATAGAAQAASSPGVSTGSASNIGDTSAVLHGSVNPNGQTTTYYFQWGLTNAYGTTGNLHPAGHGTVARAVTATATSLIPGTVYHYRVVAASRFGTSIGVDRTFKTGGHPPPGVTTGPAIAIGKFTATVTGAVSTNDEATTWGFQFGPTPGYGYLTFLEVLPASTPSATVSQRLLGLQPNAAFHYRLVAFHNGQPVSYGADQAFMTLPYPRPQPRVRANTTPRTARKRPFTFTTFGSISGPFAAALQCNGNATVSYLLGRRQVAATVAGVQPNCTFAAAVTFARLPGRGKKNRTVRLKVQVHFNGNGYLTPRGARSQTVTLR